MSLGNAHGQLVPLQPFQEAFERSGLSFYEVARRLDMMVPNCDQARRTLGYRPDSNARGVRRGPRSHVTYRRAVELCDALHVDPHEVGL